MTYIKLGGVRAFPDAQSTKEQADKVLEEAAAPFLRAGFKYSLTGEIADTITACCNLAACEERNRERGRYGD